MFQVRTGEYSASHHMFVHLFILISIHDFCLKPLLVSLAIIFFYIYYLYFYLFPFSSILFFTQLFFTFLSHLTDHNALLFLLILLLELPQIWLFGKSWNLVALKILLIFLMCRIQNNKEDSLQSCY